jgi:predicted Zn-dependent protease
MGNYLKEKSMLMRWLVISLLVALISSCAKSSTGRSQIMLYSPKQLDEMGSSSFEELKKKEKINQDPAINQFVQCVANAIIEQVPQSVHEGSWEVVVFDSEQVNAFALPGGKIGVYTGLLKVTDNQHQLAAVIGHEVGHVIEQHSNERLSSNSLAQTGLVLASAVLEANDVKARQQWMAGLGLGLQYGVLMPYSRSHESEADIVGEDLMAKSGFDPSASIELWKNMAKASGQQPPEWLSTHPSHTTRIQQLTEHLPVAKQYYKQAKQKPQCRKPAM